MKCGKFRRMIQLNRMGELSAAESKELADHIAGCATCSALLSQVQQADGYLDKIRGIQPVLDNPGELIEAVFGQIRSSESGVGIQERQTPLDRILDSILSPAVRLGTAVLAVVVLLVFTVQSALTIHSVSVLEARFEVGAGSPVGPEVAYRVNTGVVGKDPSLQPLVRQLASGIGVQVNGSLLIARRVLAQFTEGTPSGPMDMAQRSSILGTDPERLRAALGELERHATTVVLF